MVGVKGSNKHLINHTDKRVQGGKDAEVCVVGVWRGWGGREEGVAEMGREVERLHRHH